MKQRVVILIALLFFFEATALAGFKDYSVRGGEYRLLENLRLKAKSVEFAGADSITILGKEYPASKFKVSASMFVQTVCCDRPDDAWGDVVANFDILVGRDESNEVHDAFLKEIYKFWSSHPTDGRYVSQYNLTLKKDKYMMFMAPSSHDPNEQYHLIWIDGKYMKIIFRSFRDRDGAGVIDSFWQKNVKFYVGGDRIKPEFMVNSFPSEFLEMYKAGKIKLRNSD